MDGCPLSSPRTTALPPAHPITYTLSSRANGRRARWAGRNLNDARLNWPALRTSWRDQADGRRVYLSRAALTSGKTIYNGPQP